MDSFARKTTVSLSTLLVTFGLVACATEDAPHAAAERDGSGESSSKADGADVCAVNGFYADVICDQDCAMPDPDCDNAIVVRARHDRSSVIVTHGQRVIIQLASSVAGAWRVASVDRTLGQPTTIWAPNVDQLTWSTDSLAFFEPDGGVHEITLEYRRPGESVARGSFTVLLDVRPAGQR